jgi:hypothetical protein
MIRKQRPEDGRKTALITRVPVVAPFYPGEDIGAVAVRLKRFVEISPRLRVQFAAYETVVMLPGIEVVELLDNRQNAPGIDTRLAE